MPSAPPAPPSISTGERRPLLRDPRRPPVRPRPPRVRWPLLAALAVVGTAAALYTWSHHERPAAKETAIPAAAPPPAVTPSQVDRWRAAARRVEEDRGTPIGRAARVEVPPELRHYADPRRFLAMQVAAWKENDYAIPADEADLARMIDHGDFVEMPAVGEHYVLYGVGANATEDPLAHFDAASGDEIP